MLVLRSGITSRLSLIGLSLLITLARCVRCVAEERVI